MADESDETVFSRHGDRWLVEIERWDWALGLGIAGPDMDEEAKVHGELIYTKGIDIHARLVAPKQHAGKPVRVWLSTLALSYWKGANAWDYVGRFRAHDPPLSGGDFSASIFIPEDSLSNVLTCLSCIWRYIHVWTDGPDDDADIVRVSFARDFHKNLEPWIIGQGHADF